MEMKEKNNEERKSLVVQVLEVQAILENLDGDVKEDFVNGTKGAVVRQLVLSEITYL